MKSIKLFAGVFTFVLCLSTLGLNAQNRDKGERNKANSEKRIEMLTKELDLNSDQVTKIKAMWEQNNKDRDALRETRQKDNEQFQSQMKSMREKNQAEMSKILTPDQLAKYKELQKKQRQNRPGGKNKGGRK